jgi:hypothetical protein
MVSTLSVDELIAIGLLIALSLAGSVVAQLVFRRLEHHHHAEWERLGRPNLVRVSSGTTLELIRFVLTRRYSQLGDRRLSVLVALSILITAGIIAQMVFIGLWL